MDIYRPWRKFYRSCKCNRLTCHGQNDLTVTVPAGAGLPLNYSMCSSATQLRACDDDEPSGGWPSALSGNRRDLEAGAEQASGRRPRETKRRGPEGVSQRRAEPGQPASWGRRAQGAAAVGRRVQGGGHSRSRSRLARLRRLA
jgi:hypothetical protein